MSMSDLASLAGARSRLARGANQCHAADRGDVELEALATAQPWRTHHLYLGKLVVPATDTVNGFRAEEYAPPEFTDSELSGRRHAAKYIGSRPEGMPGAKRWGGVQDSARRSA